MTQSIDFHGLAHPKKRNNKGKETLSLVGIFLQASITFRSGYSLFHRLQELCELCELCGALCSKLLHVFLPLSSLSVCLLIGTSHCTWLQPGDHTLQLSEFGQSTWSVRCTDIFVALHWEAVKKVLLRSS